MKSFIIKLLLLIVLLPAFAHAQEADTLLKMDELEFVDGGISEASIDSAGIDTAQNLKKTTAVITTEEHASSESLLGIFLAGLLGGFTALLMPCIFPMLPLTVSFFTKGNQNKSQSFIRALFYGISIIVIYVVLGLAVTMIFGSDALNALSTNGIFNFFFFLMLVAFGASFLGAFEINLPSSWVNKMNAKSDKGGWVVYSLWATLALVSFCCTGTYYRNFIGTGGYKWSFVRPGCRYVWIFFCISYTFCSFCIIS